MDDLDMFKSQVRGVGLQVLSLNVIANSALNTVRASATCPQLATSNASRKDLATLQSSGATTILSRVASYSSAQHEHAMRSPQSPCSSAGQSPQSANLGSRKEAFDTGNQQCWCLSISSLGQVC